MRRSEAVGSLGLIAAGLYVAAVWFHIPYGGGHVYSDLVTVFQVRECFIPSCVPPVPYAQSFIEYPVITSFFIYAMGSLGHLVPGPILYNYYWFSCIALALPTWVLIEELRRIARMRGVASDGRLLLFFIATPTFLFVLLVNWYIIGTCLTVAAIRLHLEGRRKVSGLLVGLSAAANLVTAIPLAGLLLSESRVRRVIPTLGAALAAYASVNLPAYLLSPERWLQFWQYQYGWYIEDSWMELFIGVYSPWRHIVPLFVFGTLGVAVLFLRFRLRLSDPLLLCFLATFSFVFSNYVYTPQMNVLLLPFIVLLPATFPSYGEFILFDTLNALIVLIGFSQVLEPLGILYSVKAFGLESPIQLLAVARSLWVGKLAVYNGFWKIGRMKNRQVRPSLETGRLPQNGGS